jgi:UDP-GlcNAc:undecaprenyl-phosphate GlcNAc-1-phosphate transferase
MIRYVASGDAAGLAGFTVAFLTSLVLTPVVIRAACRLDMFDSPDGARRIHRRPVPRLGGIGVFLGAFVAVLLFSPDDLAFGQGHHLASILLCTSMMFTIGLIDDVRGLPPIAKLLGQVLAALVFVVTSGFPTTIGIIPGAVLELGWVGAPLFVFWIIAVTNAYNLIDGLNGLATGIAVVAASAAALSAMVLGGSTPGVPILALIGALVGFSRYNFPRARIFLGDSGTMSIGFLLSVLLVRSATTSTGNVLVLVPIFALMVPFLDTGLAIIRRWLRGDPLSGADARHIHHRLLAMGLSQKKTVATLWLLSLVFAGFGLLVSLVSPVFTGVVSAVGSAVLAIVIIYGTNILSYHELSIARDVLTEGPGRIRRVISDQIHAVDLCESIRRAGTVAEMNVLLQMSAHSFGLSRMSVRVDSRAQPSPLVMNDERAASVGPGWRLDFHVIASSGEYSGTLSLWSDSHDGRVTVAERVARILAPTLSEWIDAFPHDDRERLPRAGALPAMKRGRRAIVAARAQQLEINERELISDIDASRK